MKLVHFSMSISKYRHIKISFHNHGNISDRPVKYCTKSHVNVYFLAETINNKQLTINCYVLYHYIAM